MSVSADYGQASSRWDDASTVVHVVLGILLIAAAFAKGLSPADSAVAALDGRPFAVRLLIVEAELVFGILLVVGVWRAHVHTAAIVVFAGFSLVTLQSVLIGEESCGCFGAITVDPRLTLLIDLAASIALVATQRASGITPFYSTGKLLSAAAAAIAVTGVPLGVVMAKMAPVRDVIMASSEKFVLLEPELWLGKQIPLLSVLEGTSELVSGEWTVLMYHHGCTECDRVRPDYETRLARGERVLLVETPPFPDSSLVDGHAPGYTRLPDDREWFVQTPVEIMLDEGVVVSVNRHFPPSQKTQL